LLSLRDELQKYEEHNTGVLARMVKSPA
jgi:hypothetical protein